MRMHWTQAVRVQVRWVFQRCFPIRTNLHHILRTSMPLGGFPGRSQCNLPTAPPLDHHVRWDMMIQRRSCWEIALRSASGSSEWHWCTKDVMQICSDGETPLKYTPDLNSHCLCSMHPHILPDSRTQVSATSFSYAAARCGLYFPVMRPQINEPVKCSIHMSVTTWPVALSQIHAMYEEVLYSSIPLRLSSQVVSHDVLVNPLNYPGSMVVSVSLNRW